MGQSRVAALGRVLGACALVTSLVLGADSMALAQGEVTESEQAQAQPEPQPEPAAERESVAQPGPGTTVYIHGGNHSTDNTVTLNADGSISTADSSGGEDNVAAVVDSADGSVVSEGNIASGGNGGTTTADASGGTFYSPLDEAGNPIPIVETGGNRGSTINLGNTVGGDGTTSVSIYGGDTAIVTDVTMNITGGIAIAEAYGGDENIAVVRGSPVDPDVAGSIAAAGNGGTADASAAGGYAPVGTVLGGRNQGAVINVGDIIGGTGANAGNINVVIDGGSLSATTVTEFDVAVGGFASARAIGGDENTALATLNADQTVTAGNGGTSDSAANGGYVTIGTVRGELFSIIGGNNRGASIDVAGISSGSGNGGDATVGIYGGDLTANASSIGSPAYGGGNHGADIDVGYVEGGDGYGGRGGDATLLLDAGSILASASGPAGADAGDNRGANINVGNVLGGYGNWGQGGDATVAIEGSDISATGYGLEIIGVDSGGEKVDLPWDDRGASAGDGGTAFTSADAGSAVTGPVSAGDNYGGTINVGDTVGGDGNGGTGGDATVILKGTDISTSFIVNVSVDGGTALGSAVGGDDNDAAAPRRGDGSAAAGSGGFAGATADGGRIQVGAIYVGGNHGGVINVGDTIGGTGSSGGTGGNALVSLDGGSITAAVILNLEANGGIAAASADGGDDNDAILRGDGSLNLGSYAGTGGVALAEADGGTITIGDVHVGGNLGAVMTVGNVVAGDGAWGGVGGDATLLVEGTNIYSLIELNLAANGGLAGASANGGDDNVSFFDATNATDLDAIEDTNLLAGVGGLAHAQANGGDIRVGNLYAGGNVGTVVDFGDIVAGHGIGGFGESMVFNRFSGDLITVTQVNAESHGGSAFAGADGGDDNAVFLIGDVTTNGIPSAGNGGTSRSLANGGPIEIGNVTSGNNLGAMFSEPQRETGGRYRGPEPRQPRGAGGGESSAKPSGGGGGGGKVRQVSKGVGGGKRDSAAVAALPSTGAGLTAGSTANQIALIVLAAMASAAAAGYGIRRRPTR